MGNVVALADIGPAIQHDQGALTVETVNLGVNKTTKRARRVWLPDVLRGRGTISDAHHAACTRLMDSYEAGVLGARDRGAMVFVDRTAHGGVGPGDLQLRALTDFRRAEQAIGKSGMEAMRMVVLGHASLDAYAKHRGISGHHASGVLLAVVERLAEHYQG